LDGPDAAVRYRSGAADHDLGEHAPGVAAVDDDLDVPAGLTDIDGAVGLGLHRRIGGRQVDRLDLGEGLAVG